MILLLTCLAGALGAVARFVFDAEMRRRAHLPDGAWATVTINVTGSLLLGFLAGYAHQHASFDTAETILGTGFCGGYTTFSTISVETARLMQQRRYGVALSAAAGCLVLSVAAAAAGWWLAGA